MAPMFLVTLIGCFLFAIYGVLIDYYRRAWTAIPPFTPTGGVRPARTKISVLVPARNEAANIAACIASLARQSYPRHLYEVIVIDDHSTDRTPEIVRELRYPGLSIQCLLLAETTQDQPVLAHKKWAIETGIRTATGELIVTTDADCLFHPGWLATIAAFYEEKNAKFIAAPVRIGGGHHSLLAIFQTLDFITLQGITGAAVSKKFHSMCNGANLAYARSAFYEVEGFKGIDSLPSGDDMLLMHKIYRQYPDGVFFLKSPKAIVTTRPETRWKGFFNQRIRWASKADRYDDKRIFWVLVLVYILNALFAVLPVVAFWNRWWLWLLLLGLVVKTMLEYPFVRTVATFFGQRSLMVYFPLLQPLHILYTIVIGWLGKFGSYRWKDRKISK
jgi:cellulose synthase/poly-beta-1,6-N-acetylglucosamine synthase-like glycosyltransferase